MVGGSIYNIENKIKIEGGIEQILKPLTSQTKNSFLYNKHRN